MVYFFEREGVGVIFRLLACEFTIGYGTGGLKCKV